MVATPVELVDTDKQESLFTLCLDEIDSLMGYEILCIPPLPFTFLFLHEGTCEEDHLEVVPIYSKRG